MTPCARCSAANAASALRCAERNQKSSTRTKRGKGCDGGRRLDMSEQAPLLPLRLWASLHENGRETWVAERGDVTFAAWACLAAQNATAFMSRIRSSMPVAAGLFQLARLSGHERCGAACSQWVDREPPGLQRERIHAENH